MKKRGMRILSVCVLLLLFLSGCTGGESGIDGKSSESGGKGTRDNTPMVLEPVADGKEVYSCPEASLDVSHKDEGYFMVVYAGTADKVRMLVDTPLGNQYNYLLKLDGNYGVYPFSDGDGEYTIGVYENIKDKQYAEVFSKTISVTMTDQNKVFLYPNEYVDFNKDTKAVTVGEEVAEHADTDLDVVSAVYGYVTDNVEYDYEKAKTVESGYLPTVDDTLAEGKGICFDYAALMATMLRSQRIPTRLEIGYAGEEYHAWISVYTKEEGWIDNVVVFDGKEWTLMDPTLGSYADEKTVKKHMNEGESYYQLKYKY